MHDKLWALFQEVKFKYESDASTMKARRFLALLSLMVFVLLPNLSAAEIPMVPREDQGYVFDYVGIIPDDTTAQMNNYARQLHELTRVVLIVVVVDSLDGLPSEEYSHQLFDTWGIGSAERNDGMLILFAPNEREIYMETGKGIYKTITDEQLGKLLDEQCIPLMKTGDFPGGLLQLTKATCILATLEFHPLFSDVDAVVDICDMLVAE